MSAARSLGGLLRRAILVASLLALGGCQCGSSAVDHKLPPYTEPSVAPVQSGLAAIPWSISAISASFGQDCYCTRYVVKVAAQGVIATNDVWTSSWTLRLVLVDVPLAADPESPGSGAQVDSKCDNGGEGVRQPATESESLRNFTLTASARNAESTSTFVWHHPDPGVAAPGYPAGAFTCDHSKQGPSGHQGAIRVVVKHGAQTCEASYDGTKTGMGPAPNCVRNS